MKTTKINWYNFDHDKVNEEFGGDLTFINSFCVLGEYQPVAVYRAKNPDLSKGHKEFLLLQAVRYFEEEERVFVRGMTREEINQEKFQVAAKCPFCKEVFHSVMRHDFRECSCGKTSIDGGKDYSRTNCVSALVNLNLLTGKFKEIGSKNNTKDV